MTIADAVATSPSDSFPTLVSGDGELEGVYRFLSNDKVTPKGILEPHFAATRERAGQGDVLVVHDTTIFTFGGWHKRKGLGGSAPEPARGSSATSRSRSPRTA